MISHHPPLSFSNSALQTPTTKLHLALPSQIIKVPYQDIERPSLQKWENEGEVFYSRGGMSVLVTRPTKKYRRLLYTVQSTFLLGHYNTHTGDYFAKSIRKCPFSDILENTHRRRTIQIKCCMYDL